MKMISDRSLVCFLYDLRRVLGFFRGQMPQGIYFLNMHSLDYYFKACFPRKFVEMSGLLEIVAPFIPVIISQENLAALVVAHEMGCREALADMEEQYVRRAKFAFVNTVMTAENRDFEHIVAVCRKVREIRNEELVMGNNFSHF